MLDKKWFINEITKIEVYPLTGRGKLKAIIAVFYGIWGLRGFRVYQKEEDGNLITWVKVPCFKQKKYSEVPYLHKNYKALWFKWTERIRDKYLEWQAENKEKITEKDLDEIDKHITNKPNS